MAKGKLTLFPFEVVDEEVLKKVISIFEEVAQPTSPCSEMINPAEEIKGILQELYEGCTWLEWKFGSSISKNTKLLLQQISHNGHLCVGVGFSTNADTDSDDSPTAVAMRAEFHKKLQDYINVLYHHK